jgi:hypothetical protein
MRKTALVFGAIAAICGIFSIVYLKFSHGESSPFLIWMFAPSLALGMIPAWLLSRGKAIRWPGITVRRLWNSAIAVLSVGMLARAIINISGRYTEYDMIYWVLSGLLFLTAIAIFLYRDAKRRNREDLARRKEL